MWRLVGLSALAVALAGAVGPLRRYGTVPGDRADGALVSARLPDRRSAVALVHPRADRGQRPSRLRRARRAAERAGALHRTDADDPTRDLARCRGPAAGRRDRARVRPARFRGWTAGAPVGAAADRAARSCPRRSCAPSSRTSRDCCCSACWPRSCGASGSAVRPPAPHSRSRCWPGSSRRSSRRGSTSTGVGGLPGLGRVDRRRARRLLRLEPDLRTAALAPLGPRGARPSTPRPADYWKAENLDIFNGYAWVLGAACGAADPAARSSRRRWGRGRRRSASRCRG